MKWFYILLRIRNVALAIGITYKVVSYTSNYVCYLFDFIILCVLYDLANNN